MDTTLARPAIPLIDRRLNAAKEWACPFTPRSVLILKSDGQRRAALIAAAALCSGAEVRVHATAKGALAELPVWRPDLAILGVDTIDLDGLDYLPEVVRAGWATRVMIVTARKDRRVVNMLRGLSVGAIVDSYAPDPAEFRRALTAVQAGSWHLSESLSPLFAAPQPRSDKTTLLPQEELVLSLLGEGLDNQQVAERLRVAEDSVRGYRTRIMRKLGVPHRCELMWYALRHGYTRLVDDTVLHPGFERELEAIQRREKSFRLA